jgi:hypothetical protein
MEVRLDGRDDGCLILEAVGGLTTEITPRLHQQSNRQSSDGVVLSQSQSLGSTFPALHESTSLQLCRIPNVHNASLVLVCFNSSFITMNSRELED